MKENRKSPEDWLVSSETEKQRGRAQALGTSDGKSLKGDVNTIYVAANSASNITSVSKDISAALPGTTVTNSSDLASELTGSVSTASSLANNLGR